MRVILAVFASALVAQTPPFPPPRLAQIQEALREIYGLDYQRAEAICQRMIAESPDDPAGYVYLARTYWSRQLNDTRTLTLDRFAATDLFSESAKNRVQVDPAVERRFRGATEQAIARASARVKAAPDDLSAVYLLGVAHQNLASWELTLNRRWLDSARAGGAAFNYHREVLRRDPGFSDARLTVGAYAYAAGSLPFRLRWLAFLLGYSGKKERGKQELETAAARGMIAADDARTLLALFYTRDHEYDKAFQKLSELASRFPQNHLLRLEMAGLRLRTQRPDDAIAIYNDLLIKPHSMLEKATVLNWLGVAHRVAGRLADSEKWLRRVLEEENASPRSRAMAQLELGRTFQAGGKRQEAAVHYRAALEAPDFLGSRQEAERLLRQITH